MNRYLVEVEEKIIHCVTVIADDSHQARVKAQAFDCVEVEHLAPAYQCLAVKRLESDSKAGKAHARID